MEWGVPKSQNFSCEISVVYSSRTPHSLPLLQRMAQNILDHLSCVFAADAPLDASFDCVLLAGGLDANVGFTEGVTADALLRSPLVAERRSHHFRVSAALGSRRLAFALSLGDAESHDRLDPRRDGRRMFRRISSSSASTIRSAGRAPRTTPTTPSFCEHTRAPSFCCRRF